MTALGLLGLAGWGLAFAAEPISKTGNPKLTAELDLLQKERQAAQDDTTGVSPNSDRVKMRAQLLEMIRLLGEKQKSDSLEKSSKPPKEIVEAPKPTFLLPQSGAIDSLRMAQNLYKAGEIEAARQAFVILDEKGLSVEDKQFVQYMLANCLRKQGKPAEAAVLYREVSLAKDDAFLKESALWQLSMLDSTRELETQLEQLRTRKKSR